MKARKGVLEYLQKILTAQLTAVHQYLAHAAMCDDWGYSLLHHEIQESVTEKVHHSQELIKHILYLEGKPDLQTLSKLSIGRTVPEQFKNDVNLETEDLTLLRSAIEHCAKVGDFTTRDILEKMSVETDEHIDWLETQQTTMAQVGVESYLSEQIKN